MDVLRFPWNLGLGPSILVSAWHHGAEFYCAGGPREGPACSDAALRRIWLQVIRCFVLHLGGPIVVYIRAKTAGNDRYLYLVKSVWDSQNSTSKQQIIKYLGKASKLKLSDIPRDYQNEPNVVSFLASEAGQKVLQNEHMAERLQKQLLDMLVSGDIDAAARMYDRYSEISTLSGFYDLLLRPVLYDVGKLWMRGRLGVAQEHIASNTAIQLISIITDHACKRQNRQKIIICAPSGEAHSIGCMMLQSILQGKGYRVYNLSPSTPSDEIIGAIDEINPDLVMISITMSDNIKTAQRLVAQIQLHGNLKILVGGQAVARNPESFACGIVHAEHLDRICSHIRDILAGIRE